MVTIIMNNQFPPNITRYSSTLTPVVPPDYWLVSNKKSQRLEQSIHDRKNFYGKLKIFFFIS